MIGLNGRAPGELLLLHILSFIMTVNASSRPHLTLLRKDHSQGGKVICHRQMRNSSRLVVFKERKYKLSTYLLLYL